MEQQTPHEINVRAVQARTRDARRASIVVVTSRVNFRRYAFGSIWNWYLSQMNLWNADTEKLAEMQPIF